MADDEDDDDDRPRRRRRDEDDDDDDDRPRRRRRKSSESDDGGVGYVIPYKNVPALVGYYIGIIGLLACFLFGLSLFTGAAAVIFGFIGFNRARKNPEAHGTAHAWIGIILGFVQILASCGWGAMGIAAILGGRK